MTEVEAQFGQCPVKACSMLKQGRYEVIEHLTSGSRGCIFLARVCRGDAFSRLVARKNELMVDEGDEVVLKISDSEWEFRNEVWITQSGLHTAFTSPEVKDVFPLSRKPWTVCVMEPLGANLCTKWERYKE